MIRENGEGESESEGKSDAFLFLAAASFCCCLHNLLFFLFFLLFPFRFLRTLPNMSGFYSEIIAPSGSYKAFINGEWRESTSGKTVSIANPTTEATAFTVQGKRHERELARVQSAWGGLLLCCILAFCAFARGL